MGLPLPNSVEPLTTMVGALDRDVFTARQYHIYHHFCGAAPPMIPTSSEAYIIQDFFNTVPNYLHDLDIVSQHVISKSVNQPRVPEVNAGLRGKGAEMLQAIRPGVSAGVTRPLPGFMSLRGFLYWGSPCSRQSRGIYVYSINTGLLFYSPNLLDYHDYI